MSEVLRVTTIFLLYVWFCGAFSFHTETKRLINETFGYGPFDVESCNCTNNGYVNCICVPYNSCDDYTSNAIHGRVDIIDMKAHRRGPCSSPLARCCSLEDISIEPVMPFMRNEDEGRGCGWREPHGVVFELINNSDETEFGEFPWMVAILNSIGKICCGGALIHPKAVITGAHCVFKTELKYRIRAGEWDLKYVHEPYSSQEREVKSIAIHPDFKRMGTLNNIAFLLLKSPVDVSKPHVGVACLPQQGTVFSSGTRCFATGWGKDKFGLKGKDQSILRKIDMPIVGRSTCQKNLKTTRLSEYFILDESFICAGGEAGKDLCTGAGGSPLVCPIPGFKNRYQQAGIASWGIGCGDEGIPGVYADVARFRDWIDKQAIKNKLETSVYTY